MQLRAFERHGRPWTLKHNRWLWNEIEGNGTPFRAIYDQDTLLRAMKYREILLRAMECHGGPLRAFEGHEIHMKYH